MDIPSILGFLGFLGFFALSINIAISSTEDDVPILMTILINEHKVLIPLGLMMIGYQIYTSGNWGLSPETTNYILMIFYITAVCLILAYKLLGIKVARPRFIGSLSMIIVFSPLSTVIFLIIMIFDKH